MFRKQTQFILTYSVFLLSVKEDLLLNNQPILIPLLQSSWCDLHRFEDVWLKSSSYKDLYHRIGARYVSTQSPQ